MITTAAATATISHFLLLVARPRCAEEGVRGAPGLERLREREGGGGAAAGGQCGEASGLCRTAPTALKAMLWGSQAHCWGTGALLSGPLILSGTKWLSPGDSRLRWRSCKSPPSRSAEWRAPFSMIVVSGTHGPAARSATRCRSFSYCLWMMCRQGRGQVLVCGSLARWRCQHGILALFGTHGILLLASPLIWPPAAIYIGRAKMQHMAGQQSWWWAQATEYESG